VDRHALSLPATPEQKLAGILARHSDVVVDGLTGLFCQLKADGAAGPITAAYRCLRLRGPTAPTMSSSSLQPPRTSESWRS
jgi:hypothetical protein